ncbi:multidrug effflux MFS transporter [Pseudomonas moraviensis]|uniref:multidrug effflux MFS transporter n=1 Tax=Pseudomonas moraviensis TaxID=321662 RepID=UPI0021610120|nr:multidrug effflux MFS transporter [Pseudomonas moraviensis]UVL45899.1 multidrug effflux MFS transporter [Pseudomonas moraviensis]
MDKHSRVVTRRQQRGAVSLLLAMILLGVFPLDVLLPSFPALAAHFDRTPSDIALSISLFAVGIAFAQLLIGPLSDVIGRKGLLLAGMTVSLLGALGCVLSNDYTLFLIFRVMQALGCGCFVLSQALVQDLFAGNERDRLRILMVTATGIFISVSPLAGTFLQVTFGWRGSFWVFIALAAVVLLKTWRLLDNSRPPHDANRLGFIQSYQRVLGNFEFVSCWLISAFAFACHFSFIVTSPLIFMEQLQMAPYDFALILLIYGASYVFGGLLASVLNRLINAQQQIFTGQSLILISGLVMLYLAANHELSAATVLVPMLICTAGTTISRPPATSRAMSLFTENAGASASAGSTIIFICGGLVSALISLGPTNLQATLGYGFVALSGISLLLNSVIGRRTLNLRSDPVMPGGDH